MHKVVILGDRTFFANLFPTDFSTLFIYCNTLKKLKQYWSYGTADALLLHVNSNAEKICSFLERLENPRGIPIIILANNHIAPENLFHLAEIGADCLLNEQKDLNLLSEKLNCLVKMYKLNQPSYNGPILEEPSVIQMNVLRTAKAFASKESHILIQGNTGAGKGYLAKVIHDLSNRRDKPFLSINCTSIAESIFESEIFGSVEGAYTGSKNRAGIFEQTGKGTLFLDEIGDLSKNIQAKLLKIIDERSFFRVGSVKPITFQGRLLFATHRDLKKMVKKNQFREDLYYRINVLKITVPPLRKRIEDIPLLVKNIMIKINCRKQLSSMALIKLLKHSWPGNIRELHSVIQRADALSEGSKLIEGIHINFD